MTSTSSSCSHARVAKAQLDAKPVYTGERMSLAFQDIDTRAVLQLIMDTSGENIVVSDSVTGGVTLRLQNVPWDQVLDVVLRLKGLGMRRDGNVIIVAPAEELASREKADLEAKKDIGNLAPLRTEYLQVNYAKAEDIAAADPRPGRFGRLRCRRRQWRQVTAVAARQRHHRLAHQHAVDPGHCRQHCQHPFAGLDAGYPRAPGADRSAHRGGQLGLHARPGRARRLHRHYRQGQ